MRKPLKTALKFAAIGAFAGAAALAGHAISKSERIMPRELDNRPRVLREERVPANNALTRKMAANNFELFRQMQAVEMGIAFTDRAAGFKPSNTLIKAVGEAVSFAVKSSPKIKILNNGATESLVHAIFKHKSGFNPNAISPAGARGLCSLSRIQERQLFEMGKPVTNPFDIRQNAKATVATLEWLDRTLTIQGSRQRYVDLFPDEKIQLLIAGLSRGSGTVNKMGLHAFGPEEEKIYKTFLQFYR